MRRRYGLDDWIYWHLIHAIADLYTSPLHTHWCSQSSLFVSWQRIYKCLTVTAAHMKSFHSLIPFLPSLLNHSTAISRDSFNSNSSQSQSYFTPGGLQPISLSWWQGLWDSRPIFFFKLNPCGHIPYVTSSLTRRWVCRLQLLLVLASAVILRSDSRGTRDHILLSQIRDSPNLEDQVPVSPRDRVIRWSRHRVPFSLPPRTRRATVEVFEPPPHRNELIAPTVLVIISRRGPHRKHIVSNSNYCCVHIRCSGNVFAEPLPRNGHCLQQRVYTPL
jgi:hypothetical protein